MNSNTISLEAIEAWLPEIFLAWFSSLLLLIVLDIYARRYTDGKLPTALRPIGSLSSFLIMALPLVGSLFVAKYSVETGNVMVGMAGFLVFPFAAIFVASTVKKFCVWVAMRILGPRPEPIVSSTDEGASLNGQPLD